MFIFKILGIISFHILPTITVLYINFRYEDGTPKYGLMALFVLAVVFYITIYKKLKRTANKWDIQGVHTAWVTSFRSISAIVVVMILYYAFNGVADNINDILLTLQIIFIQLVGGYVLLLMYEVFYVEGVDGE